MQIWVALHDNAGAPSIQQILFRYMAATANIVRHRDCPGGAAAGRAARCGSRESVPAVDLLWRRCQGVGPVLLRQATGEHEGAQDHATQAAVFVRRGEASELQDNAGRT